MQLKYENVVWEIEQNSSPILLGKTKEGYPLYKIVEGSGPKVLVSAGVHGDEPAGVHAVLDFLRYGIEHYTDQFEFTIFPCVNPYGFDNAVRENADGVNINREFKFDTEVLESRVIIDSLEKYVFSMDFHETWPDADADGEHEELSPDEYGENPHQFYLWEICPDKSRRVGDKIVEAINKQGFQVCEWPKIYGDTNNKGVIWYPEDCGTECYAAGTAFDTFMAANHTPQAFTTETPEEWPLKHRKLIHSISLHTALKHIGDLECV